MNQWLADGAVLLFCPADRPDRYAKAAAAADLVIIDLEDAVAADRKAAARATLIEAAAALDPDTTVVRINGADTPHQADDVAALRGTALRRVLLPKTERAEDVEALAGFEVIATLESPLGVAQAYAVAAARNCVAVSWGGEDLTAAIGGWASRDADGAYLALSRHARTQTLLAAAVAGVPAIDTPYLALDDVEGLEAEANTASRMGFAAKVAIHPRHVEIIRRAFVPDADRVERARRTLAASSGAAARVDGQMVDVPLVRQAARVLALAERAGLAR